MVGQVPELLIYCAEHYICNLKNKHLQEAFQNVCTGVTFNACSGPSCVEQAKAAIQNIHCDLLFGVRSLFLSSRGRRMPSRSIYQVFATYCILGGIFFFIVHIQLSAKVHSC